MPDEWLNPTAHGPRPMVPKKMWPFKSCFLQKVKLRFKNGTESEAPVPMDENPMHPILCSLAALAVANIFYFYRSYQVDLVVRQRALRERVAYMLWMAAQRISA